MLAVGQAGHRLLRPARSKRVGEQVRVLINALRVGHTHLPPRPRAALPQQRNGCMKAKTGPLSKPYPSQL